MESQEREAEGGQAVIMCNPVFDSYMDTEAEQGGGGAEKEVEEGTFDLQGKEAYIISNTFNDD